MPLFNTDIEYVKTSIMSVAIQKIRDNIRLTIIDDCSDVDYTDLINTFNSLIDIQYIKLHNNVGSGKARQIGIESTNGKYIAFLDSDDSFYNEYSLLLLYDKIINSNCEFVSGSFLREYEQKDTSLLPLLSKVPKNQTWVFSRLFSREFLIINNISFNSMRYNEDVYFMQLCLCLSNNNKFIDNTIYVQHCNMKSLTRSKDNEFHKGATGLINFVDSLSDSYKKKRELGVAKTDKSKIQACDGIVVSYWYFIQCYNQNTHDDCERFLKSLQVFYNMVTDDFEDIIDCDQLKESYFISYNNMTEISYKYIPQIGFWDLMNDLKLNKNEVKYDTDCKYQFG